MPANVDPQWYLHWTLDIQDMSWVEHTLAEVDFVLRELRLKPGDRVLDLACGYGRHSLEFARRGCHVVGVDITEPYVDWANRIAREERLDAKFIRADIRDVSFDAEFDLVLSMADGAIGYLENDAENLKIRRRYGPT